MASIHLLIKPAGGVCNLRCSYCFYTPLAQERTPDQTGFMTVSALETVLQKALTAATDGCTISFQGGEPTLVGLEFYREAMALEERYNVHGVPIENAIQTNGVLLDEEWAEFLARHRFLVGLSLDGEREIHDLHRKDAQGKGSFGRVAEAARLLKRYGVEFHVLAVVTARSARKAESLYRFFRKQGLDKLQFIPCLDPLEEAVGGYPWSLTPQAYGSFLCTLFDSWYQDFCRGNEVYIRRFENYVGMLAGIPPENCAMYGVCGQQLVVEADGSVYPCDFYVLDRYRLGNLCTDSLEEIEVRRRETGFVEASAQMDGGCRNCSYFPLCRGGCRRDRETEEGTLGPNHLCAAYRQFFDHCLPRMERLAAQVCRR